VSDGGGSRDEFEDALLRVPRRDSFDVVVGSEMSTAWLAATVRQEEEGVLRQLARDRAAVVGLVIIVLLRRSRSPRLSSRRTTRQLNIYTSDSRRRISRSHSARIIWGAAC
jgi:hypothetical protein